MRRFHSFYEADFIALRSQLTLPTKPTSSDDEVNSIFEDINRDGRLMFSICVKQRPIPSLCWKNRSMLLHSAQNSPIMLAESEFAVTVLMNLLSWRKIPTTSNLERLRFPHLGYTSFSDCASVAYSDLHYIYTLTPSVMVSHLLWAQLTPTHKLLIARDNTLDGSLGVRH